MHLKTRNVNTAFRQFVEIFTTGLEDKGFHASASVPIRRADSRNGKVLMIDEPVIVTYSHPRERVLFNSARDANPFFHLYESLWMLAGRNDVAPVAYYAKRMKEYSDDGKTLNGAYGYRWRMVKTAPVGEEYESNYVDQLDILVAHLKADPNSRRAVLQMWNVEDDLLKIGSDLDVMQGKLSKDVCCNLSVMFSLRDKPDGAWADEHPEAPTPKLLDMTVTNRSNDLVWGMLGANYVHFTFLQEYMAARLGAEVGVYNHVTNNLHAYIERKDWKPEVWLCADDPAAYNEHGTSFKHNDNVTVPVMPSVRLVNDPAVFEKELPAFVEQWANPTTMDQPFRVYAEPFLQDVATPMMTAFLSHKLKTATAMDWTRMIKADDWRVACEQWLIRRLK